MTMAHTSSGQMKEMITMAKPRKSLLSTKNFSQYCAHKRHRRLWSLLIGGAGVWESVGRESVVCIYCIMYYKFVHSTSTANLLFARYHCVSIWCTSLAILFRFLLVQFMLLLLLLLAVWYRRRRWCCRCSRIARVHTQTIPSYFALWASVPRCTGERREKKLKDFYITSLIHFISSSFHAGRAHFALWPCPIHLPLLSLSLLSLFHFRSRIPDKWAHFSFLFVRNLVAHSFVL